MGVSNKIIRPVESTVDSQPKLHPAFLRLSAMISQYFTLIHGLVSVAFSHA